MRLFRHQNVPESDVRNRAALSGRHECHDDKAKAYSLGSDVQGHRGLSRLICHPSEFLDLSQRQGLAIR
jgi:hypothetical protein